MDDRQVDAVVAWLHDVEQVFGHMAQIFEDLLDGEHQLSSATVRSLAKFTREFESRARQFQTALIVPPSKDVT